MNDHDGIEKIASKYFKKLFTEFEEGKESNIFYKVKRRIFDEMNSQPLKSFS